MYQSCYVGIGGRYVVYFKDETLSKSNTNFKKIMRDI